MKRRIKFRGKCAGTWFKGDHLTYANGEVIKAWMGSISPEYDVEPESVGQFTGTYDYEGNEIYEGDICETNGKKVVVAWDKTYLKFDFFYRNGLRSCAKLKANGERCDCKVIGNIFDNPEILEGAK